MLSAKGFKSAAFLFYTPAYVLCNFALDHLYFRSSVLEKAKQNVEAAQENRKQITTRSMPICLCMPLGLKSFSKTLHTRKGEKANWISDDLSLIAS